MLKILTSVTEYLDFVGEMNRDPDFSDPMLSSQETQAIDYYATS